MGNNNKQVHRFSSKEVKENRYFKLYKWLFEGEYKGMSNDVRVAYSLLVDRHELSLSNGWVDKQGFVFLVYTRANIAGILGCSERTVTKIFNELKYYFLIECQAQGMGKPQLIYMLKAQNIQTSKFCSLIRLIIIRLIITTTTCRIKKKILVLTKKSVILLLLIYNEELIKNDLSILDQNNKSAPLIEKISLLNKEQVLKIASELKLANLTIAFLVANPEKVDLLISEKLRKKEFKKAPQKKTK